MGPCTPFPLPSAPSSLVGSKPALNPTDLSCDMLIAADSYSTAVWWWCVGLSWGGDARKALDMPPCSTDLSRVSLIAADSYSTVVLWWCVGPARVVACWGLGGARLVWLFDQGFMVGTVRGLPSCGCGAGIRPPAMLALVGGGCGPPC